MLANDDHDKEWREFEKSAGTIRKSVAAVPGVTAEVYVPEVANHVPTVRISWHAADSKLAPMDVVRALRRRAVDWRGVRK